MSKTATPRAKTTRVTTKDTPLRNPAPRQNATPSLPLRFLSWPSLLSFCALCLLVLTAPLCLSGFWPGSYDDFAPPAPFGPLTALSLLTTTTACVCLMMALRPQTPLSSSTQYLAHLKQNPIAALLCAFFIWCALSVFTTVYLHDTLIELSRVGCCVVWFHITDSLLRENDDERSAEGNLRIIASRHNILLACLVVGILPISVPAFLNVLRGAGGQFGSFSNNNFFANFGAMMIPLSLAWVAHSARGKKMSMQLALSASATLIITGGVFSTTSKGGFLSMLAGVLIFCIALYRAQRTTIGSWIRAHRAIVTLGVFVLLVLGSVVTAKTIGPRFQAARGSDNNSTMFRVYTWRGTTQMAQARPVLGWGAGTFPSAYAQFATVGFTQHAHQNWLQIAAENGVPAVLLLLGVCGVAARRGWRSLKGKLWPFAAGAMASIAAFFVHGFIDYGWGTTSIILLFAISLALIPSSDVNEENKDEVAERVEPRFALRPQWLLLTLLLIGASWWLQRVVAGAQPGREGRLLWQQGSSVMAQQRLQTALEEDALEARWWLTQAQVQAVSGLDADASFRRATQLQPTSANAWRNWAEYRAVRGLSTNNSESPHALLDRAVNLSPNSTSIRLARAKWLLSQKDERAWNDFQHIVSLRDAPYGRYPALAELTNLDFARASIELARHFLQTERKDAARQLVQRSLAEIKGARAKEEYWGEMASVRPGFDIANDDDLDRIEGELNALKEQLQ